MGSSFYQRFHGWQLFPVKWFPLWDASGQHSPSEHIELCTANAVLHNQQSLEGDLSMEQLLAMQRVEKRNADEFPWEEERTMAYSKQMEHGYPARCMISAEPGRCIVKMAVAKMGEAWVHPSL